MREFWRNSKRKCNSFWNRLIQNTSALQIHIWLSCQTQKDVKDRIIVSVDITRVNVHEGNLRASDYGTFKLMDTWDRTNLTVSGWIFCLRMPSANRFRMHFAKAAGVLRFSPQYRCGSNSIARKANCDTIVGERTGPIALRNLRWEYKKRCYAYNSWQFNR